MSAVSPFAEAASGARRDQAEGDDPEIIARVLDGDVEAYGILLRRHSARVTRLGRSFFRDEDEVADFVQDVFIKAYAGLGGFRGSARFSTWLLRIAYNTAINQKKRNRDHLSLDAESEIADSYVPGSPGVEVVYGQQEDARAVREALSELPPRQALCVELSFFYDLRYEEISAITGFPVNTIKSHVFRAKRILREKLGSLQGGSHAL